MGRPLIEDSTTMARTKRSCNQFEFFYVFTYFFLGWLYWQRILEQSIYRREKVLSKQVRTKIR